MLIHMTDYAKLKVAELKELLKARGLHVAGTKPELVARLAQDDAAKTAPVDVEKEEPAPVEAEEAVPAKPAAEAPAPEVPAETERNEPVVEAEVTEVDPPAEPATTTATTTPAAATTTTTTDTTTTATTEEEDIAAKTAQVVAELKKRIERSKRFNGGTPDAEAVASLKRIEKFGLQSFQRADKILAPTLDSTPHRHRGGRRFSNHGGRRSASSRIEKPAVSTESSEILKKRRERFAS